MLLVASLCEGYHWTLDEAMSITMPQAIMLNHATWVSHQNSDRKYDAKRAKEKQQENGIIAKPHEKAEEAYVNSLNPAEMSRYMSQGWD
jgi:hypothetical protein